MNDALVLATFLLVAVTALLVWVTHMYAGHTRDMVEVMRGELQLRTSPLYDIRATIDGRNLEEIRGRLIIRNNGYVSIFSRNTTITVQPIGQTRIGNNVLFYEINEVEIQPGQTKVHNYIGHVGNLDVNPIPTNQGFFGVACNVVYRTEVSGPNHVYEEVTSIII